MSVTDETQRVGRELRTAIRAAVDDETRALVKAWDRAWRSVVAEWEAAVADVLNAEGPTTIGQIRRMNRARNAVTAATDLITKLLAEQATRLPKVIAGITDTTGLLNARQIATQLPRTEGTRAELTVRFDRVSPEALDAIVRRSTQRITSQTRPLSKKMTEQMLRTLVGSIPQGLSPRDAARRLLRALEGKFNGGLARALTITRTEMLDAYRAAAGAQQNANRDVLGGWVWSAQLDNTTCASCVALHGTEHPLDEAGPWDHQNGRCARTPLVKPWSQLGFTIKEPPTTLVSGPDWFAAQPEATQLAILGPERLDLLQGGKTTWPALSSKRTVPGWRDSYGPTPAASLVA